MNTQREHTTTSDGSLPSQILVALSSLKTDTASEIQAILVALVTGMKHVLGNQLIGLYLTGSLSYGDFDVQSSDIDFIAILSSPLTGSQRKDLAEMHDRVGRLYPKWEKRIDGSYLTSDMLISTDPPKEARPFVNGGEFRNPDPVYGYNWAPDMYNLRNHGLALYGSEPRLVFPNVDMEMVAEATLKDLNGRWAETAKKSKPFEREGYDSSHLQAYAVVTMCRLLRNIKLRNMSSKKVAAKWAKQEYPEWKNLIEIAEMWQVGQVLHEEERAKNFILFTINELS